MGFWFFKINHFRHWIQPHWTRMPPFLVSSSSHSFLTQLPKWTRKMSSVNANIWVHYSTMSTNCMSTGNSTRCCGMWQHGIISSKIFRYLINEPIVQPGLQISLGNFNRCWIRIN
jgi:hypothetical protein